MRHATSSRDLVPTSTAVYRLSAGPTARDIAAVLFRRKRIIFTLFASIVAAGLAAGVWLRSYFDPPRYMAGLKLILKKDRVDAVVTPSDRSVPGIPTSVSPQEIHSEVELLKSLDVQEQLARQAGAAQDRLGRDLVVEPVVAGRNLTNLIAVRFTGSDRAEVARVLEKLPEVYLEKHLSVNRRPAALEYFRSQAEAADQQLREAEEELAEFEKQQPSMAWEANQLSARQRLSDLERQRLDMEAAIREEENKLLELNRRMSAVPALTSIPKPRVEAPYLTRLKTQLLELEAERSRARLYRDIEQLDRRIEGARQAIADEGGGAGPIEEKAPNPLRNALESERLHGEVRLAGLRSRRGSVADQERKAREQTSSARLIAAENAVERADLARSVKAAEEEALFYRKKYSEAREADLLDERRVLNVAVAEQPRPPVRVKDRNVWLYFGVLILMATGSSVAAGLVAEALDHSIHTPRELEDYSSLAVLACLPESRAG